MITFVCEDRGALPSSIMKRKDNAEIVETYLVVPLGYSLIGDFNPLAAQGIDVMNAEDIKEAYASFSAANGGSATNRTLMVPGAPAPTFPLMRDGLMRVGGGGIPRDCAREMLYSLIDRYMDGLQEKTEYIPMTATVNRDTTFSTALDLIRSGYEKLLDTRLGKLINPDKHA